MTRLLVVEDDRNLADSLATLLRHEGFLVDLAHDRSTARTAFEREPSQRPGLVILDWNLPDGQGIDLVREWRERGLGHPVIMLTARAELVDRVLGLEFGADDYVTKPFEPRELVARVRARLRSLPMQSQATQVHGQPVSDTIRDDADLRVASFRMNLAARRVFFHEREVELTRMEWNLLRTFLESPDRVFSRDELLNEVWGLDNYPTTRTVDNHVLQLRNAFGTEWFQTVRGVGYRFVCPPTSATDAPSRVKSVTTGAAKIGHRFDTTATRP